MRKLTYVLGVPFDTFDMNGAVNKVLEFLSDGKQHIICTPNPEIVMEAQCDNMLMKILKSADLVVPDGIGVVWASKYSNIKIKERVAGYDLIQNVFDKIKDTDYNIYFFGGASNIADEARKNMIEKYKGINIVGTRNGYFDKSDEEEILNEIKSLKTDILLVGLGAPKQEKWIYENIKNTNAKVCIGVGGSFDVMSGNIKRAPSIFCKFGLEWFYRLVTQPTRIKRMMRLPKFAIKVLREK